ncbi:MAG TPA: hypothetical protein VJ739_15615 [Gemmataceae bacterium]|nr:hypothetical protein [Gemmataceae bacterium]
MDPNKSLADELYRERVRRARAMPPEVKLFEGARLFDRVCRLMADGIRNEHPEAGEDQVRALLVERLRLARRLEQGR